MRILAGACLAVLALAACDRSTDKGNAPPADGTAPAGTTTTRSNDKETTQQ